MEKTRSWVILDATNQPIGRVAVESCQNSCAARISAGVHSATSTAAITSSLSMLTRSASPATTRRMSRFTTIRSIRAASAALPEDIEIEKKIRYAPLCASVKGMLPPQHPWCADP